MSRQIINFPRYRMVVPRFKSLLRARLRLMLEPQLQSHLSKGLSACLASLLVRPLSLFGLSARVRLPALYKRIERSWVQIPSMGKPRLIVGPQLQPYSPNSPWFNSTPYLGFGAFDTPHKHL